MLIVVIVQLVLQFFVFVECLTVIDSSDDAGNLVAVAVTFRHGDRAPEKSFPNDEYFNKTYWPMGFGQMTKYGIMRQYRLGQWFRQRYQAFLSDVYSPDDIYIYSTDKDRTLASAYSVLAGLYPPRDFQIWNDLLPWQPIPVHTMPRPEDQIIVTHRECKKFESEYEKIKQKRYEAAKKEHKELFEYIQEHTGWADVSLDKVANLRSNIYAYSHYNKSFIPEWTRKLDQNLMNNLSALTYELPSSTPTLARLRTGPFFDYLIKHFDAFTNSSSDLSEPKFLMVSGHDTSLSPTLDAMGAFKWRPVNFGDTIIWELRKKEGGYFLNVLYKRGDDLENLYVHDCDFDCDYGEFKRSMENVTISIAAWKEECKNGFV